MPSTYDQYTQGDLYAVLPSIAEKPRYVATMFGRIARRYDLMNSIMTLGQDARWRRFVAGALDSLSPRASVLDVGTGTGHLAQTIESSRPDLRVVGADFTLAMLRQAPAGLRLAAGDALRLPFRDEQFDAVVSGFLVRNLPSAEDGLVEQLRVLRPGGTVVILETTPGPGGVLQPFYRLYFRRVVPMLGGLIAGDASAYTYLPESTLNFLEPSRLAALLLSVGFERVRTRRLMFGCVAITVGRKPVVILQTR